MLRARLTLLVGAIVLVSPVIGAQDRPNLSGTWVMARPGKFPPELRVTITQDATSVAIDSFVYTAGGVFDSNGFRATATGAYLYRRSFVTDGVERPVVDKPLEPPTEPPSTGVHEIIGKATWIGQQLVIMTYSNRRTSLPSGDLQMRSTSQAVYSLDSDGNLVWESLTLEDPVPDRKVLPTPTPWRAVLKRVEK